MAHEVQGQKERGQRLRAKRRIFVLFEHVRALMRPRRPEFKVVDAVVPAVPVAMMNIMPFGNRPVMFNPNDPMQQPFRGRGVVVFVIRLVFSVGSPSITHGFFHELSLTHPLTQPNEPRQASIIPCREWHYS